MGKYGDPIGKCNEPKNVNPDLNKTNTLLSTIIKQLTELTTIDSDILGQSSRNSTVNISITSKYYDTGLIPISIATVVKPDTYDIIANAIGGIPGYDDHPINRILGRNAPTLTLISDAGSSFYVVVTSNNLNWSTAEVVVEPGEARTFYDVYDLRLRNQLAHSLYRITEYNITKPKNVPFFVGNPYISETSVANIGLANANIEDVRDGASTINGAAVDDTFQALRRNAHSGEIANLGPGNIFVAFDAGNGFSNERTIPPNNSQDLESMDIARIRLRTDIINTNYRLAAQ